MGAIAVLLFRRDDRFAVYHAKQSLGLVGLAIVIFVVWTIAGWIISWIPFIGFILAMATLVFGILPGWPLKVAKQISNMMFKI